MRDVVDSGRVTVTNDAAQAVRDTELSFVCVGTPSAANGSQDLTAPSCGSPSRSARRWRNKQRVPHRS